MLISAQSCDGIMRAYLDAHPQDIMLLDSMRINKDSFLYVFSHAQSEEYLCFGNSICDIADTTKTIAQSDSVIMLDSVSNNTVFVSTYFSLDEVRKTNSIIIKSTKLNQANKKVHNRLWLELVKNSSNGCYLKDPIEK
jgi:hypothetical protein